MSGAKWTEKARDTLSQMIRRGDSLMEIRLFCEIENDGLPDDYLESDTYAYGRLWSDLNYRHDMSLYKYFRSQGLPSPSKHVCVKFFRDMQYSVRNDAGADSAEKYLNALLDDGLVYESSWEQFSNPDMRELFVERMPGHVALLERLHRAGFSAIPVSNNDWRFKMDDIWQGIIDRNSIDLANYYGQLDSQYLYDHSVGVFSEDTRLEMVEWLVDHGVTISRVGTCCRKEVLARCTQLGAKPVSVEKLWNGYRVEPLEESALQDCLDGLSPFYILDDVLMRYEGADQDVVIPDGITRIADGAFNGNLSVVSIAVPEGVSSIGDSFCGCENLERVILPATLEDFIPENAFRDCPRLLSVDLRKKGKHWRSAEGVLFSVSKNYLKEVFFPAAKLEDGICEIPDGIAEVEMISSSQADGFSAKQLILPASVKCFSVWEKVRPLQVEDIEVSGDNSNYRSIDGVLFNSKGALVAYPPLRAGEKYVVPEGTKSFSKYALGHPRGLKEIVLPSTFKRIEERTFAFSGVETIKLPASMPTLLSSSLESFKGSIEYYGKAFSAESKVYGGHGPSHECRLLIPNVSISTLPSELKRPATLGYMELVARGFAFDNDIEAEYAKYVRSQKKKLFAEMFRSPLVADYMLGEAIVPAKEVDRLLEMAKSLGDDNLTEKLEAYKASPKKNPDWRPKGEAIQAQPEEQLQAEPSVEVEPLVAEMMQHVEIDSATKACVSCGVKLTDGGGVSSPEALQLIVSAYKVPRKEASTVRAAEKGWGAYHSVGKNEHADAVAALLDKNALSEALEELFFEDRAAIALGALGRFANDNAVSHIVESIPKWDDWYIGGADGRRDIGIARGALLLNDSVEAMKYIDSIQLLDQYASMRKTTADEIRDLQISDFGFDKDGKRLFDLGGKTIVATIGEDLKIELYDEDAGKSVRSLPKRGADPAAYETAKEDLAQLKKDIRKIVKQRKDLLLEDFIRGRSRDVAGWKRAYLDNPVLRSIARLVVWDHGGSTFTIAGGKTIDSAGNQISLGSGKAKVKVAHPIEMSGADVVAWRDYFARNGLKQPFEQVWERVAVQGKSSVKPDRYKGFMIPAYRFKGREKHGIHLETGGYRDYSCNVWIDSIGLEVVQHDYEWETHNNRLEIVKFEPYKSTSLRCLNHIVVYLDRCCFYPRLAAGDMTVMDELDGTSLADIIDYIRVASESDATELAAALLAYREEHFPEYGGVESLLLD